MLRNYGAERSNGIERHVVLGTVGQNNRNRIALAYAAHGQHRGGTLYLVIDLRIGVLASEKVDGNSIGKIGNSVWKKRSDCFIGDGQLERDAFRVVLMSAYHLVH